MLSSLSDHATYRLYTNWQLGVFTQVNAYDLLFLINSVQIKMNDVPEIMVPSELEM